jgi:hypothetical protein
MHISNAEERAWIMHEFERTAAAEVSKEEKLGILQELTKAETFNSFLSDKLKTSKRFGVEGLDSMISGLSNPHLTQTNWSKKQSAQESNTSAWEWRTEAGSTPSPTSSTSPCRRSSQNSRKTWTRSFPGATQET